MWGFKTENVILVQERYVTHVFWVVFDVNTNLNKIKMFLKLYFYFFPPTTEHPYAP